MTERNYFSYVPDDGTDFHATADEARKRCQEAIDDMREHAEDGWDDAVTGICWGVVHGMTEECDRVTREQAEADGDEDLVARMDHHGHVEMINYRLVDVPLPE
ncbi:MAG: hypothetical protein WC911_02030 [Thermoleophilia bacterium]